MCNMGGKRNVCALAPMVHHRRVCTKLHGSTISQSTRNDLQQWQPSTFSLTPSRQYEVQTAGVGMLRHC